MPARQKRPRSTQNRAPPIAAGDRAGGYRIVGDLTMRGATHPVELSGTLVPQGAGYRFAAKAVVDRQQWGITWNKSRRGRDLFIDDKVTLQFSGALSPAR
ncbi:MAG: YceI family protein [bacterium]